MPVLATIFYSDVSQSWTSQQWNYECWHELLFLVLSSVVTDLINGIPFRREHQLVQFVVAKIEQSPCRYSKQREERERDNEKRKNDLWTWSSSIFHRWISPFQTTSPRKTSFNFSLFFLLDCVSRKIRSRRNLSSFESSHDYCSSCSSRGKRKQQERKWSIRQR